MRSKIFFLFLIFHSVFVNAQTKSDTIQYCPGCDFFIRTYDDIGTLRLLCEYSASQEKLIKEEVYLPDGRRSFETIWYGNKFERNVFVLNTITGKTEFTEIDSMNRIITMEENSDSISDSKHMAFYFDGNIRERGFIRMADSYKVKYMDSVSIGPITEKERWPQEVKTGEWHYYYENGVDSATGNYFPVNYSAIKHLHEFDTLYNGIVILVGDIGYSYRANKTGTWKYYSPDGKLIYTEEWDKGNLLKRE